MKTWIFTGILSALFVIALCAAASAQCPGGVCQQPLAAPVKASKSVLVKTTEVVAAPVQKVQQVRKAAKFRLFRRWR